MKKIYMMIMLIAMMTILTNSTSYACNATPKVKVTVDDKTVKYKSKPYMTGDVVMLPVKQTAEALGAKVETDKKNNKVWINLGTVHVELPIGKSECYIHHDYDFSGIPMTVKLDTAIKSVKGIVYIPGKVILENMGMNVSWDSKKKVLAIKSTTSEDISQSVPYVEITQDDISNNKALYNWYNDNVQKQGISYKKDGKYVYVLIGGGEKPTGGYTISIDNIFYSAADTVTINAKINPPGDNVRVMMVITYPSKLIRIESEVIKTVSGEVVDTSTISKEKWITMDASTIKTMVLYNLDNVKIRDITGTEKDDIMKSFNEATIDQNSYIEMIAGNILKVTTNDGYEVTFTSYGSKTNVIAGITKDGETRTFHLVAPVIAETLLKD